MSLLEGLRRFEWRLLVKAIEPYPREHWNLKLIALGLSFMLWATISSEVPVEFRIQSSPVQLLHVPEELALAADYPETIDVSVAGRASVVEALTAVDIRPRIDLSEAQIGQNVIRLSRDNVRVPATVDIEDIDPAELTITLDRKVQVERDVVSIVEGEPAEGYQIVGRQLDPDRVTVEGPQSLVEEIESVRTARVNVRGRTETLMQQVAVVLDPEVGQFVDVVGERDVALTVEIAEMPVTETYTGIAVAVVNTPYRVAINPERIDVIVDAPPSVLEDFGPDNIVVTIDATGLEPRQQDYLLEPQVAFDPPELGDVVQVVDIAPQHQLNVRIYDQRRDRR